MKQDHELSPKRQFLEKKGWANSYCSQDRRFHLFQGEPLYKNRFDEVMSFHFPGLAPARIGNHWFHIRENGQRAYDHSFERVWGFYYGLSAVNNEGEAYHINAMGHPAYTRRYSWCGNFQENVCSLRDKDGNYFHITLEGEPAYPEKYVYVGDFKENFAAVYRQNEGAFHIDSKGIPIYGHKFLEVSQFHKGVAGARDGKGWFHIYPDGKEVYSQRYKQIEPFYNNRAKVTTLDGRILTILEDGSEIQIIQKPPSNSLMLLSHDLVGYWKSFALGTAIDLHIFQRLPATADQLSKQTGAPKDKIILLLQSLMDRGYVKESERQSWEITSEFETLTTTDIGYLESIAKHWLGQTRSNWENLTSYIKEDSAIQEIDSIFDAIHSKPSKFDDLSIYHRAMEFYATINYSDINERVDFSKHKKIIDAGGGTGYLLSKILEESPNLEGTVLDTDYARPFSLMKKGGNKIEYVVADIFNPWKVRGDAVILSRVIHDWDDSKASLILNNARNSLYPGGTLYVIESLVRNGNGGSGFMSLHLSLVNGGKERTLIEYKNLLSKAGFAYESDLLLSSGLNVIVFKIEGHN